ncbi:unnamed protein product [Rhizophagus irregularis]|nr:unnamed protein product [Rhizophagus irregularis]
MPIIIVHVVFNSKTVFEWEGLPVNKDMNIQEFFKDVVVDKLNPELWEKIVSNGGGWIGKDNANNIGKKFVTDLAKSICQRVITARNQSSLTPVVDEEKAGYIEILDENTWRKPEVVKEFRILTKTLEELEYWEPVNINLFCPVLRKQRFRFVEKLKVAFPFKDMINKHYTIRNNLKQTLQVYHTRAMRKEFLDTVELYIGK